MNEWKWAAAVLAVALAPCLLVCLRARVPSALVALELSSVLCTTILVLLCEGTHRQPFIDLALLFVLLSSVGAIVVARLMEHDT
ncbi:MAG TPA: MrpF/PhaF family protein [Solirubrobacteraceae bacterium]|jgi:multisubunit Na+/H+ antiporter MnhF subunit|nr:MrpF/PhaF family protein [Solirubrobacteraceae bacterium]